MKEHPSYLDLSDACTHIHECETESEYLHVLEYMATLQKNYGQEREYWMWKESDAVCMDMMRLARKIEQNAGEPDPFDPCKKAYGQLNSYCAALRANHGR